MGEEHSPAAADGSTFSRRSMPGPGADPRRSSQDQRLEVAIANLLRIGVFLAAALVLAGGVMAMRHSGIPAPDYSRFRPPGHPQNTALVSLSFIFGELRHGSSTGIIGLGLLVLIATPIARVLFALAGFARERDRLYTVISFVVLAILVFSLLRGR
jgi:uncharacterized membrane protein